MYYFYVGSCRRFGSAKGPKKGVPHSLPPSFPLFLVTGGYKSEDQINTPLSCDANKHMGKYTQYSPFLLIHDNMDELLPH
mmetsp:Transcript_3350/g.4043  ORF Transcript_3350/g.4043 Transcript_3350/m.4043 type:complete len:80 (+) Transcript_3350:210-449(+)